MPAGRASFGLAPRALRVRRGVWSHSEGALMAALGVCSPWATFVKTVLVMGVALSLVCLCYLVCLFVLFVVGSPRGN